MHPQLCVYMSTHICLSAAMSTYFRLLTATEALTTSLSVVSCFFHLLSVCKCITCWDAFSSSPSQSHTLVELLRFLKYHFSSSPSICHWSWRENWHRLNLFRSFFALSLSLQLKRRWGVLCSRASVPLISFCLPHSLTRPLFLCHKC